MVAEPPRAPCASSAISLVPRQVTLAMSRSVFPENDRKAKEKKAKKEKPKISDVASAEERNLDLKRCGGLIDEGRGALLHSIAAFLESNGFSRTLAVFLSEARLEKDDAKGESLDLEDILCRFLKLSKTSYYEKCTLSKMQGDRDDNFSEKGKESGVAKDINFDHDTLVDKSKPPIFHDDERHMGSKQKKRKNRSISDIPTDNAAGPSLGISKENMKNLDKENQLNEAHEKSKAKKKKKTKPTSGDDDKSEHIGSEELCELVEKKMEDLKSLVQSNTCQLDESDPKSKSKKKKKQTSDISSADADHLGSETAQEAVKTDTDPQVSEHAKKSSLAENVTNDVESGPKDKKKGKKKSTIEIADQLDEGLALKGKKENSVHENLVDMSKSDSKFEKVPVLEEATDNAKNKKSKRKKSAIKGESHIDGIDGSIKSEEGHQKMDAFFPSEGDNNHVNKKHKPHGIREDTKPSKTYHGAQSGLLTEQEENTADGKKVQDHQKSNGTHAKKESDAPASVKANKTEENQSAELKTGNAFQRVKIDKVHFADERLQDNSYWAKGGAETGYGAKAQEVLGQVKGRDFRHEKTKKKRGSYRGGQIDFQSHSIKFNYSDEE